MTDDIARRYSDLTFGLDKSIRYHHRRRAFFEMVHRWMMFLVVIAGSAAASSVLGSGSAGLAIVAALLGAIDLAYSPGSRGRDHLILHQQYSTLLAKISRVGQPTDQDLRDWKADRLLIEADEPPIFWALDKDCYNEICFARGKTAPENLYKLTRAERWFMQLFRFDVITPPNNQPA